MRSIFFLIFSSILFSGCIEIYEPEVESDLKVLTVDGLFTDDPESYSVHLRMARQFDSIGWGTYETGAGVSLTDDLGQIYPFKGTINGNYVPDNSVFRIRPDRKYTLDIITPDGNQYKSSAQELIPNKEIDNIYGRLVTKTYLSEGYYGETIRKDYEGIETFIDFFANQGQSYAFKFKITLLIEYTYINGRKYFAWRKYDIDENINITESKYEKENQGIVAHPLSFFPLEKSLYNIQGDMTDTQLKVVHWILIVDQYRLNDNTCNFYKKIKKQLAAEGTLFDPVAAQINGNIRCTNDSRKIVLGNFEISSKETSTYVVSPEHSSKTVTYIKVPNLLNVPDVGPGTEFPPDFWIN
jgi:hypothetical protein